MIKHDDTKIEDDTSTQLLCVSSGDVHKIKKVSNGRNIESTFVKYLGVVIYRF